MKKFCKMVGIFALLATFGFTFLSITSCEKGKKSYALGSTGPGGGIVFYVSAEGFTMTDTGKTCYYFEAAPSDMSAPHAWASSDYLETDAAGTETGIGAGRKNTALILAVDTNAPAAIACKNLKTGGKNDWFLPSREELNELYKARTYIGNMGTGDYWSSSQYGNYYSNAWLQDFSKGHQDYGYKFYKCGVRAIRAF